MYKTAGNVNYKFGSMSLSEEQGLGFNTLEEAVKHTNMMNKLLDMFETNSLWNKQYWKIKPKEWITFEM